MRDITTLPQPTVVPFPFSTRCCVLFWRLFMLMLLLLLLALWCRVPLLLFEESVDDVAARDAMGRINHVCLHGVNRQRHARASAGHKRSGVATCQAQDSRGDVTAQRVLAKHCLPCTQRSFCHSCWCRTHTRRVHLFLLVPASPRGCWCLRAVLGELAQHNGHVVESRYSRCPAVS